MKNSTPIAREVVTVRAYERFVHRGMQHGFDLEDWLEAKEDVRQSIESALTSPSPYPWPMDWLVNQESLLERAEMVLQSS